MEQEAPLTQPVSGFFSAKVRTKSGPCQKQKEMEPGKAHSGSSSLCFPRPQEASLGPETYSTWIQKLFYLPILSAVLLF